MGLSFHLNILLSKSGTEFSSKYSIVTSSVLFTTSIKCDYSHTPSKARLVHTIAKYSISNQWEREVERYHTGIGDLKKRKDYYGII